MQNRFPVLTYLTLAGSLAVSFGCDELEVAGRVQLRAPGGTTTGARTFGVTDRQTVGAGVPQLGGLVGNLGQVRYATGQQRTTYVFEGDLAAGFLTGLFRAMPRYDAASPSAVDEGDVRWNVVNLDLPQRWRSFRTYDSGECSATLAYDRETLPGTLPAFAKTFVDAVDAAMASCAKPESERLQRVSNATFTPRFRAGVAGGTGLRLDTDTVRFEARYQAPSIGGCKDLKLDVAFEAGFRRGADGNIVGVAESVWSEVDGFCIVEGTIEDATNATLAAALPTALASAVRDQFSVDARLFELPVVQCLADVNCRDAYPGTGHRCMPVPGNLGECRLQLNVDRVNVRPEGVEFVIVEGESDPQYALRETPAAAVLCGPSRVGGVLPSTLVSGALRPFLEPPTRTTAEICG